MILAVWLRWSKNGLIAMTDGKVVAKMSKVEKAAILLLSLGEADAAQVLRHMGPKEVQRVGLAMAQMTNIHRDQVELVMSEFVELVGEQTGLGVGSDAYIRKMLTQALGEDKAGNLIDRILLGGNTSGLDSLKWMEPRAVDRKSTRLNSSHVRISYAVFCLKKKKIDRSSTQQDDDEDD